MSIKLKLIETLATFGEPGQNCIGNTTVAVDVPPTVKSTTRFSNTVANKIEAHLTEQDIDYRCYGGTVYHEDNGTKKVHLDFKKITSR